MTEIYESSSGSDQPPVRRERLSWRVVVAVVAALVGVVVAAVLLLPGDELPEHAVFELDGRVYVESDLRRHLVEQQALYGVEVPDLDDEEGRRLAAQSFAVSLVVDAAAEEAGVTVAPSERDLAAQEFLDRTYPGGRSEFVDALADEGVSESDVLDELERQLRIERLYAQVTADLAIEPEEVRSAYDENPEDFEVPHTRRISAIAVANRSEALRLRPSLTPDNFAAVARRRSLDTSTAPQGGDLGFVWRPGSCRVPSPTPPSAAGLARCSAPCGHRGPVTSTSVWSGLCGRPGRRASRRSARICAAPCSRLAASPPGRRSSAMRCRVPI